MVRRYRKITCNVCGEEAKPGCGVAFQNRCERHKGVVEDEITLLRAALEEARAYIDAYESAREPPLITNPLLVTDNGTSVESEPDDPQNTGGKPEEDEQSSFRLYEDPPQSGDW